MVKVTTNPDKNLVKKIREKIKANNGHCACAISFNDSNKCMCEEFKKQIDEGVAGECHCGLFEVVEE